MLIKNHENYFRFLSLLYIFALYIYLTTMAEKKRGFPKRKDVNCTSFNFILCGEVFKKVQLKQDEEEKLLGKRPGYVEAIKRIILGK